MSSPNEMFSGRLQCCRLWREPLIGLWVFPITRKFDSFKAGSRLFALEESEMVISHPTAPLRELKAPLLELLHPLPHGKVVAVVCDMMKPLAVLV